MIAGDGGKKGDFLNQLIKADIILTLILTFILNTFSSHPYIFFNNDNITVTFVGFHITPKGNLLVPGHATRHIMTPQLYQGIHHQKVDFTDDYQKWSKQTMISKLSMVMGIEAPTDPDETYVLTIDNLIKILAIQMRFRCGIPVVIMGETGCGKTRLIRYMCDLARNECEGKNMLIKKVFSLYCNF